MNGYVLIGIGIVVVVIVLGLILIVLMMIEVIMCFYIGRIYCGDDFFMKEVGLIVVSVGLVAVIG